jgi:hypothetical protein
MKNKLLKQTLVVFTIFIIIGLGLTPVTSSNKIIEENEKELNQLTNYLIEILQSETPSETNVDEIVNNIENMIIDDPTFLRKTLVISQGWSYDANIFKNSKLQIKNELFSFWHYAQASKTGRESKTIVIRPNDLMSSKTLEIYRGTQTGFMLRPFGLYCFQKKPVTQLSYSLFIGFASYAYVTAQEEIQVPFSFPFQFPIPLP